MARRLVSTVLWLLMLAVGAAAKEGTTSVGKPAGKVPPGRAIVERVGWEVHEGRARLVVAVSGALDFTTHAADADPASGLPPRVYVDLRPALLGKDVPRTPQTIDDSIAQRVRVGQFSADTVRLVVDLSAPALFEVRTSERPPRLFLGLAPRPPDAAVARAAPPPPSQPEPTAAARAAVEPPVPTSSPLVVAKLPEATPAPTEAPPTPSPDPTVAVTASPALTARPHETIAAPAAPAKEPPAVVAAAPAEPPVETSAAAPAPAHEGDKHRTEAQVATAERAPPAASPEPRRGAAAKAGAKQARPQPSPRVWTVVLDPGHGGRDPGAHGVTGDEEKDITLTVSRLVAEQLAEDQQIRVVLTRNDDSYVSLEQRTAIANAQGADLFVSIHANASENPQLAGVETYTLNNTDDRATIRLAALENGLALTGAAPGERDLAYILSDLVQTGKEDESVTLARAVQGSLVSYLRDRWRGVANLGVKKGPFYVLVGAYMPCVLVEVAFLSNETEGQRIAARRYQLDVADGIAQGIRRFLASDTANANL